MVADDDAGDPRPGGPHVGQGSRPVDELDRLLEKRGGRLRRSGAAHTLMESCAWSCRLLGLEQRRVERHRLTVAQDRHRHVLLTSLA